MPGSATGGGDNIPNPYRDEKADIAAQGPGTDLGKFVSTAYGPPWNAMEGSGITSRGTRLGDTNGPQEYYIVAVDPEVIPYGTLLDIQPNPFGTKRAFLADDTGDTRPGGLMKGKRIDFLIMSSRLKQNTWGRRSVTVKSLGKGTIANVKVTDPDLTGMSLNGQAPVTSNPFDVVPDVAGAVGQVADAIKDAVNFLVHIFGADSLFRFAKGLGGGLAILIGVLALLYLSISILSGGRTSGTKVIGKAASVTPVGKAGKIAGKAKKASKAINAAAGG